MRKFHLVTSASVLLFTLLAFRGADDSSSGWRQWGGPDRHFQSDSTGLARSWPAAGPRELWSRPLGEGYSTVIADEATLYTMYREEPDEIVVALAASSGETRWEHRYPAPLLEDMDYGYWLRQAGPGPYATPLLVGDRLYSVGGSGRAVVAFDQVTGVVGWKRQDFQLAPASPIVINVDGEDQLVVFAPQTIVGLDPRNGELLWSHPHETNHGLNISTPVWGEGNLLFCSSAYKRWKPRHKVHARAELMTENAWTPPTLVGTKLYVRDRKNIVALDLSE